MTVALASRCARSQTDKVGCARRPSVPSKLSVSGRPEQRSASMPCSLLKTTPPCASDSTVPGRRCTRPSFGLVRVSTRGLPTAAAANAEGLSTAASRFFSRMMSSKPATMALSGSIPSATPSKRSRLSPACRCTVRVSVIRAKPFSRSSSIDPEAR